MPTSCCSTSIGCRSSPAIDNLPVGTWQLEIDLGAGGLHRRTVDVRAGEVTAVRIDAR